MNLMNFIKSIELGIEAKKNVRSMQTSDVYQTYADTQDLFVVTGYKSQVGVAEGVANLVSWYKEFYQG